MDYFGTDGIRGEVSQVFSFNNLSKISLAIANTLKEEKITKICIGQDTRVSSDYISNMLISTLLSKGIDVENLGVVSTPVISFAILKSHTIDIGIMISASHNPYQDNGIKLFGSDGKKISEIFEKKIEKKINEQQLDEKITNIGKLNKNDKLIKEYIEYLESIGTSLKGKVVALDLAHGSATSIAPIIFENLGAKVLKVGSEPDGYNINLKVGSTNINTLSQFIKSSKEKIDFGFAYDGDADRVMLLSDTGEVLDGDYILYILAEYLKENLQLKNNKVVLTVMANLALKKGLENLDIQCQETQVGDKYVMQMIDEHQLNLGGEQSGHIIISNLLPTGDGILTSVFLAKIITEKKINLKELINNIPKYPQKLVNIKVKNKNDIMNNESLKKFIHELNEENKDGRILVRSSGTEEIIRVMVENEKNNTCNSLCDIIVEEVKKLIN